jgi:hypothetical protein
VRRPAGVISVRAKLETDSGQLDAAFSIAIPSPGTLTITLESSGGASGGQTARNPDYAEALEEILERSARIASTLNDCLVVSRVARDLRPEDRRVTPKPPPTSTQSNLPQSPTSQT